MTTKRWTVPTTALIALGLAAAACGDDSSTSATTTTAKAASTTAATASSGASTTAEGGSTTTAAGTSSTAGGSAGELKQPDYSTLGQDPTNKKLYKGTGDFTIDTSKCPSDWDPKQGITDKEIALFLSLPRSGPFAGFGLLADGAQNYFDYVNANGGVGGRSIKLTSKDDAYKPEQTKANVDEALQAKRYAALYNTLGTANNLAIWDEVNDQCMPQLQNATGAPQWGDVKGHPWTTGWQLDYWTEASIWVDYLKKQYPDGGKIAMITFNNDFGKSYSASVRANIKGSKLEVVKEELHEATAPNLTNNFTNLANSNADILLINTSGTFCTQAMAEVEKGSWKPKTVIASGTCGSLGQFFKPLIDQGLTGKDTIIVQYVLDPLDPSSASNPFVKLYNEQATKAGLDPKQTTYFTGWALAWNMVETLKAAEKMRGGLDRANIMIAARSLVEPKVPYFIGDAGGKMEGTKDAYWSEFGRLAKYTVTDPKQFGTFQPISDVISVEGKLGTYDTVKKATVSG